MFFNGHKDEGVMERKFEIFKDDVFINNKRYWPITYILKSKDGSKIYIGKSRDFQNRMKNHDKDEDKKNLKERWVISHTHANESISYYLESFLIHFGRMNMGVRSINTKIQSGELYKKDSFYRWNEVSKESKIVYEELCEMGIFKNSLEELRNHAFSKLNPDLGFTKKQMSIVNKAIKNINNGVNFHIKGAAGTGKTAILIKIINDFSINNSINNRSIAVYSSSVQNRRTIKKYINLIKKNEDILFFETLGKLNDWIKINKDRKIHLLVDEAQTLSNSKYGSKIHLQTGYKDELEWINSNIDSYSLFFDLEQSDYYSDINLDFNQIEGEVLTLEEQFRIKADTKIFHFFKEFLGMEDTTNRIFEIYDYDIEVCDDVKVAINKLRKLSENEENTSKILYHGYNKESQKQTIDGVTLKVINKNRSNDVMEAKFEEVMGSVRMKGLSIDNSLVIISDEIKLINGKIVVDPKKWVPNTIQELSLEEQIQKILSSYYILLTRATSKLIIYIEDDNLREYFTKMKNERLKKSQRKLVDYITEI